VPGHVSNYAITTTPNTSAGGGGEAPDKSVLYWDGVNNLIKGSADFIFNDTLKQVILGAGGQVVDPSDRRHIGGAFFDPTAAKAVTCWVAPFAVTILNVKGYRVGGTGATVNARLNGASTHLASDLSLSSANTWMDGGAVQNVTYAAGDSLELLLQSVAGSPSQVTIQVNYRRA